MMNKKLTILMNSTEPFHPIAINVVTAIGVSVNLLMLLEGNQVDHNFTKFN